MPLALYYCLLLFILVVAYIPFVHEKAPSISLIESVIRATCNHLSKNRALKSAKCFTHTFQPSVHSLCLIPLFFLIFRLQTLTMKYFVNWLFYKKLNIISVRYWLYTHWWSFPSPFLGWYSIKQKIYSFNFFSNKLMQISVRLSRVILRSN